MKGFVHCLSIIIIGAIGISNGGSLEAYNVDPNKISTSGLSGGAYMAVQMHVAHSKIFSGVGVIAGGPYWCAQNNFVTATNACMESPSLIIVDYLQQITRNTAATGFADPVRYMQDDYVYLFSGTLDSTVVPGVTVKAEQYYAGFVPTANIKTVYNVKSVHGFPTFQYGEPCHLVNEGTYINKCNYDAAYDLLEHIHGPLQKPVYPMQNAPEGSIVTFDQREFFGNSLLVDVGLADSGYLFVPNSCADKTIACALHVAFHGCHQGAEFLQETYVKETGYNEVAALNDIIVMYPQVESNDLKNPNGCFDWWGYTGSNYASNRGEQVSAVRRMIDRVTGV